VFSHIITEAFALEGVTVIYKWVPWKRAYEITKEGGYDATPTWVPTPEREQDFYFSNTILVNQKVFFHLKSFPFDWETIKDLQGMKIGGTLGYTYGEAVKEGKLTVDWVPRDFQNFRKLAAGRIQIFPQEFDVGYAYIHDLPPEHAEQAALLTHHPKPLLETTHHLIFSKQVAKNQRLLELFNKGLKTLKESGKLDKYFEASRQGAYKQ